MTSDGQTDTAESHQLCAARNVSRFGLDWGLGWAVWAVVLATALLLVSPVLNATMRFGLDYSEGWNAIHAARLMAGEPLYPAFDALIGNNYPPLSFYAAGWLGYGLGDYLLAGRLLAFAGLLTSAAAATAIVKLLTGRIKAALLAGLLLLGYNAAVNTVYVGLDDPQWLGHGIMVLGLLAFLASEQRGFLFLFSAALMLAAGFVKHLLFPIPLAATLWLLLYRRAVLAHWLAACSALSVSALIVCFVAYGSDFFQGVFHDVRSWSWGSAISAGAIRLESALPLLLLGAFALPSTWRIAAGRVIVFYAAISTVSAVYVSGGAGVDINAIFDLDIALCLMIGVAIAELERGEASVGPA
ncbi:MAG TPA: hypothetical protein VH855_06005 [Acetobacteraceae bacterium]|jgi:hypothetical protein